MTDPAPRLDPVRESEMQERTRAALEPYRGPDGEIFAIWATLAHHEDALRRFLVFGNHVLAKNTLPVRLREIAVLRVATRAEALYEWDQHVLIARRAGLDDTEIIAAGRGDRTAFGPAERAVLDATDALIAHQSIDDELWTTLRDLFDVRQVIDLLYTVGQYLTIATVINTLGVHVAGEPALPLPTTEREDLSA